jgi:hypothetical protein
MSQWNSPFNAFLLIIEGATEKALQFIMRLWSICNKNFISLNENVFLNATVRFKQEKVY